VVALEGLQEEGLVDYELLHFTSEMPFEDQVATISRVDVSGYYWLREVLLTLDSRGCPRERLDPPHLDEQWSWKGGI
jgi:hypothetical protein